MPFSHDIEHSLTCVVDLANTRATRSSEEQLGTLDDLRSFVERHELSEVGALTRTDLVAVQALRDRVRPVFHARDDTEAAVLVNDLVAGSPVTPRLTAHDGYAWHLHYFAPGASVAEHLAVDCGMALAHLVATGERERMSTCAAPDCENVLVDLSRNRSKRYCDARTCGNRLHVAAYRQRRRAGTS